MYVKANKNFISFDYVLEKTYICFNKIFTTLNVFEWKCENAGKKNHL